MQETFRGYVAPWECDEMGHMNIQFYADKFAQSLSRQLHVLGAPPVFTPGAQDARASISALHMRFHKELHASDLAAAQACVTDWRAGTASLAHHMYNDETDTLAATARFETALARRPDQGMLEALAEEAAPRSLTGALVEAGASGAHMRPTNRSAVHPHECDGAGFFPLRGYFSRLSDAQGHMWRLAGLGRHAQKERGLATATVELHFSFFTALAREDLLEVHTGLHIAGAKVLHYRHRFIDPVTGALAASADGIGLLFDKSTRRAVTLPEEVRTQAARYAI